jgi:hypothetical protein
MKKMILLAALALAWPAWGQAPAPKPEAVKSAPAAAKPAPRAAKAAKKRSSLTKRHQDARHCLQRTNNDAIIRCAEEYL